MRRVAAWMLAWLVAAWLAAPGDEAQGRTRAADRPEVAAENLGDEGLVGAEAPAAPTKALQDTVWIADWSFDAVGGGCTDAGWVKWDNRVLNVNDDSEFWHIDNRFDGQGGVISGNAAILSKHDLCWAKDGYGNDADFSIILKYSGSNATLDFDKASDGEPFGYDVVTVEADSGGVSELLGDPSVHPDDYPAYFRWELFESDGLDPGSHVHLDLPHLGAGTHEVYIRFSSDGLYSDQDGLYTSAFGAGLVVDNIVVTGGIAYSENFEGALDPNVTLIETANALHFLQAPWLRVFSHITDNDVCTENPTCAWLGTDPNRKAYFPDMGFGPGEAVIRNWLDDIVASPWVSLASTPGTLSTVLSFRRFPGNSFGFSNIVQGWRVRAKLRTDNTDTPAPGDSFDCVSPWGHASMFNSLDPFTWVTSIFDMTPYFERTGTEIQVSFRTVDWAYLVYVQWPAYNPGPGPFWDRVRIGRRVYSVPAMSEGNDSRSQAQDAFPAVVDPSIMGGEHHVADGTNRFGTCAFSQGADLGFNTASTRLVTGDSIWLNVIDTRNANGIASVRFYGAITSGVHQGKVPGPYASVGGFFAVDADSARGPSGAVVADRYFIELDDTYFRGGDAVKYFWAATDNMGGFASMPAGLAALPSSVAQAEVATGGLHEATYLPTINWDPSYQAAVAASPTGDVDPTPEQIAASSQANCILYYQKFNSRRRSGAANRTSFMYTLDQLGYGGHFDVYDVQGYGNTCNQLAGRANVAQASGYSLIIQDDGRSNLLPNIPNGQDHDSNEIL